MTTLFKRTQASRKYRLALYIIALMFGALFLVTFNPVIERLYSELVAGLIGAFLVYSGGNVGAKFANKNSTVSEEEVDNG